MPCLIDCKLGMQGIILSDVPNLEMQTMKAQRTSKVIKQHRPTADYFVYFFRTRLFVSVCSWQCVAWQICRLSTTANVYNQPYSQALPFCPSPPKGVRRGKMAKLRWLNIPSFRTQPVYVDAPIALCSCHLHRGPVPSPNVPTVEICFSFPASPARQDNKVVFPQPEGPSTASGLA